MPTNITSTAQILSLIAEMSCRETAYPQHGDIAPLRAAHLSIVRPWESEATDAAQRQQDAYTALSSATVTRKRTKRGTSVKVVRYGRSLVGGCADEYETFRTEPTDSRIPVSVILHALEETRTVRDHDGNIVGKREHFDGIGVARIATLAYDLPDLLGGEFKSWSELLPEEVGRLCTWNIAGHTTGAYSATNETKLSWPTRYRMPALRMRKGEQKARSVTFHDGQTVTRFAMPSADISRAFMGHHAYMRPAASGNRRDVTTRADRAARARAYDVVTFPAGSDALTLVAHLAEHMDKGARVKFTTHDRTLTGTLTRAPKGKLSAVVGDVKVKGVRTVGALLTQLAPALIS